MVNSGERKTIALKFFLKLKELEYSTKKGESPVNLIIYHPAPRTVPTWAHSPSFEVRLFKGLKKLMWRNGRRARLKTSSFWGVGSSPIMSIF